MNKYPDHVIRCCEISMPISCVAMLYNISTIKLNKLLIDLKVQLKKDGW